MSLLLAEPEPREIVWPGEREPVLEPGAVGTTLIEQCDGSRIATRPGVAPKCGRWKIEWSTGGKVWGVTAATSAEAVVRERERLLGYVRQSARFFDTAIDARWSSPTAVLCEACEVASTSEPGAASDASPDASRAWMDARVALSRFETATFEVHASRIRELARLAAEPATAKLAKAYVKQIDAAVIDAVRLQLALDNAAVTRSAKAVVDVNKAVDVRTAALEAAAGALVAVVAKAAAKLHAGRYGDDASTDPNRAQLVIAFSGDKVTATLVSGEAESQWFEGNVVLDGSISGRSLVAPENGTLSCNGHTTACGYVWAPAALRFADRDTPKGSQHVVELWFQQSKWVHAKPFSR
jgi:hypothetical protein